MHVLACLCLAAAAYCAVRAWNSDRQLQRFRGPTVPQGRFAFVPLRWQREIYLPEGAGLVDQAWRYAFWMAGLAIGGMLLLAFAG